jgi:hypothetical protein
MLSSLRYSVVMDFAEAAQLALIIKARLNEAQLTFAVAGLALQEAAVKQYRKERAWRVGDCGRLRQTISSN